MCVCVCVYTGLQPQMKFFLSYVPINNILYLVKGCFVDGVLNILMVSPVEGYLPQQVSVWFLTASDNEATAEFIERKLKTP